MDTAYIHKGKGEYVLANHAFLKELGLGMIGGVTADNVQTALQKAFNNPLNGLTKPSPE